MPIGITNGGDVNILQGANAIVYKIKRTPIATVLSFPTTTSRSLHVTLPHPSTVAEPLRLSAYTVEFLWKTMTQTPRPNNADPSLFWTIYWDDVTPGFIFSRIGLGTGNQWSIATFSHEMSGGDIGASPPGGIVTNRWYHLAYTFGNGKIKTYIDGQLITSKDVTATEITFARGFAARFAGTNADAGTSQRNHTMVSEFRFWSVERTPEELSEYMYAVNPEAPGLLSYFKLDDGTNALKDSSPTQAVGWAFVGSTNWATPTAELLNWVTNENISIGPR
jgi:hypothetical protein